MATSAAEKRRLSALPDDLLHTVYARLAGPVDRVRFAAVCASWRAVASTHPPRLPWLILDPSGRDKEKHVYCPADGAVLPRFSFPNEAVGGRFVGSHGGGWIAFLDEQQLRIVNLFSGAEAALSPTQRMPCTRDPFVPQKVIFSEPPTLSGCILAAITDKYGVAICGLGRSECAWRSRTFNRREVMDIAFCNGDLYCIMSCTKQIIKFEVGLDECGFAVFKSDPQWLVIHNQWDMDRLYLGAEGDPDAHAIYIVELRGKLVMVVRRTGGPRLCSRNTSGPFFLVFELVDADVNRATPHCWYKWKEVRSLGDQTLFLGPTCSKAMHLPTTECGGLRRNHIYYSHRRCYTRKERLPDDTQEFLTSSNTDGSHVYFKEDERVDNDVEGITSVGYYVLSGAQAHPPMWVLPPDV